MFVDPVAHGLVRGRAVAEAAAEGDDTSADARIVAASRFPAGCEFLPEVAEIGAGGRVLQQLGEDALDLEGVVRVLFRALDVFADMLVETLADQVFGVGRDFGDQRDRPSTNLLADQPLTGRLRPR